MRPNLVTLLFCGLVSYTKALTKKQILIPFAEKKAIKAFDADRLNFARQKDELPDAEAVVENWISKNGGTPRDAKVAIDYVLKHENIHGWYAKKDARFAVTDKVASAEGLKTLAPTATPTLQPTPPTSAPTKAPTRLNTFPPTLVPTPSPTRHLSRAQRRIAREAEAAERNEMGVAGHLRAANNLGLAKREMANGANALRASLLHFYEMHKDIKDEKDIAKAATWVHSTYLSYFGPELRCALNTRDQALQCERNKYNTMNKALMRDFGDDLHSVPTAWLDGERPKKKKKNLRDQLDDILKAPTKAP